MIQESLAGILECQGKWPARLEPTLRSQMEKLSLDPQLQQLNSKHMAKVWTVHSDQGLHSPTAQTSLNFLSFKRL